MPQTPGQQEQRPRTHVRLFTAIGAVVVLVVGLLAAAVVLQSHGAPNPAATQAQATGTNGAIGEATPNASSTGVAASALPTSGLTHGPLTGSSSLASGDGTVVYSDDFHDRSSGWPPSSASGLLTFAFTSKGYVITAGGGELHHLIYSPNTVGRQQLSMSLTATLATTSAGGGLGVTCRRGEGASEISYELTVLTDGRWFIDRRPGDPRLGALASNVANGSSATGPGAAPITMVGMCATLADGRSTRLAVFVNGTKIADTVDPATLPVGGWLGGIVLATRDLPVTVTATSFEERDLSK